MHFFRKAALLFAVFAPVAVVPLAHSQAVTTITATSVNDGTNPVSGTLCLTPVNQFQSNIAITKSGGGFYEAGHAFCQTLASGALTGSLSVPNPLTDSSPSHGYSLVIYNSFTGESSDPLYIPSIGGTSWSLDTYIPAYTIPTTNAFTLTSGSGSPATSCVAPALDYRTNSGTTTQYVCSGGTFSAVVGPAGPPVNFRGSWASGTTYAAGDAVSYTDGSSYISLTASNVGNTPNTSTANWALLAKSSVVADAAGALAAILPPTQNYFDLTRATGSKIVSTADGTLISISNDWYASDYIPVSAGAQYTLAFGSNGGSGPYGIAFYDGSKMFVSGSGINLPYGNAYTFTSPVSGFARFSANTAAGSLSQQEFVRGSALPSSGYVPFSSATSWVNAATSVVADQVPIGTNLFDPAKAQLNTVLTLPSGTTTAFSGWYTSAFIPVEPGTTYTMGLGTTGISGTNTAYGLAWYLADQTTVIASTPISFTSNETFTAPAAAAFVRFPGIMQTQGGETQAQPQWQVFTKGSATVTAHTPSVATRVSSPLAGVNVAIWGDSITAVFYEQWQQYFFSATQANYLFQDARGGREISQIFEFYGNNPTSGTNDGGVAAGYPNPTGGGYGGTSQLYTGLVTYNTGTIGNTLAQDIAGAQLCIVGLTTNDTATPLGSLGDTHSAGTVYGNLDWAFSSIQTANPTCKLMGWTPYISTTHNAAAIAPLVTAMQQVGAQYGAAIFNASANLGFNAINDSVMLVDGLHPNSTGMARLGKALAAFAIANW